MHTIFDIQHNVQTWKSCLAQGSDLLTRITVVFRTGKTIIAILWHAGKTGQNQWNSRKTNSCCSSCYMKVPRSHAVTQENILFEKACMLNTVFKKLHTTHDLNANHSWNQSLQFSFIVVRKEAKMEYPPTHGKSMTLLLLT